MSGHELDVAPAMFIGAAANPFADPFEYRVLRLAKKIEAGADFIQTQCIYNMERFREWMKMAADQRTYRKSIYTCRNNTFKIRRYGKIYE